MVFEITGIPESFSPKPIKMRENKDQPAIVPDFNVPV